MRPAFLCTHLRRGARISAQISQMVTYLRVEHENKRKTACTSSFPHGAFSRLSRRVWTTAFKELGQRIRHAFVRCSFSDIEKFNVGIAPYPYASDGKFHPAGYFDLNAVTWWTIQHQGISLLGHEYSTLPLEVAWKDVLDAMRYNLDIYWAWKAQKPRLFLFDIWVMTAVATLCRILTAIEEGEIISKSAAFTRWRDRLPARWQTLIDEAWRIRQHLDTPSLYRSRIARMRETLAFIEDVRTLHKDFLP